MGGGGERENEREILLVKIISTVVDKVAFITSAARK